MPLCFTGLSGHKLLIHFGRLAGKRTLSLREAKKSHDEWNVLILDAQPH